MGSGRIKGSKNRVYSPEFKIRVVESIEKEHLGVKESCRKFGLFMLNGIENHSVVLRWQRIYLKEGAEGLYREHRGRSGRKGRAPGKLPEKAKEDLVARVQRLEMENEYLKKLDALVRRRERGGKKSPK